MKQSATGVLCNTVECYGSITPESTWKTTSSLFRLSLLTIHFYVFTCSQLLLTCSDSKHSLSSSCGINVGEVGFHVTPVYAVFCFQNPQGLAVAHVPLNVVHPRAVDLYDWCFTFICEYRSPQVTISYLWTLFHLEFISCFAQIVSHFSNILISSSFLWVSFSNEKFAHSKHKTRVTNFWTRGRAH